ncbi:MAG TPA: zf-HC2 domain-containing protein, partial [bacterium]|nr:zf-HC2 domain-containing protein [bacterium]
MTCLEARAMIPAFVDQELSSQDAAVLERHLGICVDCARAAAKHRSFVKGLREHLPQATIPADLKTRVMAGLRTAKAPDMPRPRGRRWLRAGALVATAFAALFMALALPHGASDAWTQFYRDEHQAHSRNDADVQVRSDSAVAVAAWLAKNVGHPVHVPIMPDAQLIGARTTVLRGQTVSVAMYRSKGEALSLFVGDPKVLCPSLNLPQDQLYTDA